jgi:hypothetical protein
MHEGVKYINRNEAQPPTIIPPTAQIEDIVYPTDYVNYEEGQNGGWREDLLFPDAPSASKFKGQVIGVYMPLQVNGVAKTTSSRFRLRM